MNDGELREAMKEHFGSFGEACFNLAWIRKDPGARTDRRIEDAFDALVGHRHRKCFNKKEFILSCREPD